MGMAWGQWRNASRIWYRRFSTVGLSFEVKIVERGRFSLFDRVGMGMGMETE